MSKSRITVSAIGLVLLAGAMDCTHGRRISGTGGKDGSMGGTGGATGASTEVTGGAGGAEVSAPDADIDGPTDGLPASEPCGEATCLTALFQTCVPQGSCTVRSGGSPSAVYHTTCYANGVEVSAVGIGTGAGTSFDTTVGRDGAACYTVKAWAPAGASGLTYTISGANGEQVATGVTADKSGLVTVTCNAGEPITVSAACLEAPDNTASCAAGECPSNTGGSGGTGGTGGTTGATGGSTGGSGGSTEDAGLVTSTDGADALRCTLARGPDSEPGSTCQTYCDDLRVMCTSTPDVPATTAECVSSCNATFTEAQLCCRAAHLMNGTVASAACQEALGKGACQ